MRGGSATDLPPEPGKTRITIRLESAVLDYFRRRVLEMGRGIYQTLINDALRAHIRSTRLEDVVRRTLRQELRAAANR